MTITAVLPFVVLLVASQPAPVGERLLGHWAGEGVVTGRASSITMTWERAIGGAFIRLRFRNAMAASATRPPEVFEAEGFYKPGAATTGTWIDSRGVIFPLEVVLAADTLTSTWGSAATEQGRTVYRLTSASTLEVIDSVKLADGTFREFGKSTLFRK